MKALVAKLVWPAYLAALVFFGYVGIDAYSSEYSAVNEEGERYLGEEELPEGERA